MTSVVKIKRGVFQHVEAELYAYHDTLKEIERIREEIIHATPKPDLSGGSRGNLPSDQTGGTVTKLLMHKRLHTLSQIAEAIKEVYESLPPEKQRLMKLRYWTKPQLLTWEGIALEIGVSSRQAMRWRDQIVSAIALKLGWR